MNMLIVVVGLGLASVGALLSWHQKNAVGIWATYAFGFLLVLTSGPISSSLRGFSLTGEGLDVKFTELSVNTSEVEGISAKTAESIKTLSVANSTAGEKDADTTNTYIKDIVEKLIPFIRSLGYAPTQIVGSPNIRPGSMVSLSGESLSLLATPQEAFSDLKVQVSPVALPTFEFSYPLPQKDLYYKFVFECNEGATSEEASFSGLISSWNKSLNRKFLESENAYVVQSVLLCSGLQMASSRRGGEKSEESRQDFEFRTKDKITIGYKLARVSLE
ncbi:MAG: hypothetical protein KC643_32215 [Nitrospira sp.]|nr:hypothetical protein [Nitrospira sp.]